MFRDTYDLLYMHKVGVPVCLSVVRANLEKLPNRFRRYSRAELNEYVLGHNSGNFLSRV